MITIFVDMVLRRQNLLLRLIGVLLFMLQHFLAKLINVIEQSINTCKDTQITKNKKPQQKEHNPPHEKKNNDDI